jgi:hypothetical protein
LSKHSPGRGNNYLVTDDEARLRSIIGECAWLMRVLATVRDSGLPDAWVGAGTVRDLVWGQLFGPGFAPADVRDVDVPFFDQKDLSPERDERATATLHDAWPEVPWEATNQAAVHTWYHRSFGGDPVSPLRSVFDAVATWPETATAVAVRLGRAGQLEVCAPLGLADLLAGVWRRNDRSVSLQESLARLGRHRPAGRWPGVKVIAPSRSLRAAAGRHGRLGAS